MKHSAYWRVLQHLLSSCWVPSAHHSIQSVAFFAVRLLRFIAEVTEVGGPLILSALLLEVHASPMYV